MKKTLIFLLLALSCSKQSTKSKLDSSQASTATNEILTYASINSVCGDENTWKVKTTLTGSNPNKDYWLVFTNDSSGHVISFVRIHEGTATYNLVNGIGCPDPQNCGFDITPIIWVYQGAKPVVGDILGSNRLAQYSCPLCASCN